MTLAVSLANYVSYARVCLFLFSVSSSPATVAASCDGGIPSRLSVSFVSREFCGNAKNAGSRKNYFFIFAVSLAIMFICALDKD